MNDAAEGNLISGNTNVGVQISNTSNANSIAGNIIGLNAAGTAAVGNGVGIRIDSVSYNNIIGGTTTAARNVISGNTRNGIEIDEANSNVLIGNWVGLNAAGTDRIANLFNSIQIANTASGNRIGTDGDGVNDIGERNVISGAFSGSNVNIIDFGTSNNVVAGNYIGTIADGSAAVLNGGNGIRLA